MGIQKKHGKGRLDKWYKLAKEKGYRARAAFKLIQLNKKYGFLEKSKVLLDLCAAPGSWCQVAAETMPVSSLIVGVDLSPIKPIPRVITFQSDITTEKCRATIRTHFKSWKADTVLHDGAPNVGTAWVQDSFNQAELALQSLKLATEFLAPGGTFVTKVFRSKDYNSLLWVFNQLFTKFCTTPNGDVALAALDKLPETTDEIRNDCADLRVLGRKEFRNLLKWRLKVREKFGFATKKSAKVEPEEVAEVEDMDEELKIQEELQAMSEKESSRRKREKRRENEKKQREIVRMQLHMTAPTDIGLEQAGPNDCEGQNGNSQRIRPRKEDGGYGSEESESDDEQDRLDRELDSMYEMYQEQKSSADAKFRAKKARKEHEDGDWEGFSAEEAQSDDDDLEEDSSDESDDEGPSKQSLLTNLERDEKKAEEEEEEEEEDDEEVQADLDELMKDRVVEEEEDDEVMEDAPEESDSSDDESGFEIVKRREGEAQWEDEEPKKDGRLDIDIITAEAMTLAQQIASGQKSMHDLADESFNKYAFKDRDGLPDWFLDDESKHDRPHRPISAAGAAAIKEKLRALNARPIKKVREAKDRKKFKAAQRLEKLRKKSALLADEEGMTEKEKANSIGKLMSKAAKKKPKQNVKVVVATGGNRGIAGRPRGVKGKYKIVDARLKKDVRGLKRAAKKRK
ncbi:hypothetical protein EYC84_008389 [Monilinia fructicola]|uniref:AdoMet-dependent rRNA methyltransferase SPB1 n=1 Tax=Monilinia fructicola TaxID=38448 RepID=A0A5M9JEF5_MONFR|nr:hypothetical protein EYC84_008389 [Monilinia fructicola]